MKGDCKDKAGLIYRLISEFSDCFDDPDIVLRAGIVCAYNSSGKIAHAFSVVDIENSQDFWILDNGAYEFIPVKSDKFFNTHDNLIPLYFFNFQKFEIFE